MLMSAAQPASIKVHKTSGTTMEIVWKDGHQSTYTFTYLRNACPCAICNEEREKSHRAQAKPPAQDLRRAAHVQAAASSH